MEENRNPVLQRLEALRLEMKKQDIDFFLTTSSDFHSSEYVGDYFKVSEYFSGCSSDNVNLLVSPKKAWLWTDGRYFISAAAELEGSSITLMKMGEAEVPSLQQFLKESLKKKSCLGYDGRCVSARDGLIYRRLAAAVGARIADDFCPADTIWTNRPALSTHPIFLLSEEFSGESCQSKLARVRELLKKKNADYLILSKLDDIMWLLNIRGGDILYNPVALSYLILGQDFVTLFLQKEELTEEVKAYASKNKIELGDYHSFYDYIEALDFHGNVLLDPSGSSDLLLTRMKEKKSPSCRLFTGLNPTSELKAVKNERKLKNLREIYLEDSVALCHFLYYIDKNIGKIPMTEISAAKYLDQLRSEISDYIDLSFGTISAYNANAAMAHYAASPENCADLKPEGFLLVDSGGQYLRGTTDVTRTIALGPLSEDMIRDFTLVAMSNLRLLYARFPAGCTGVNLDTYARAPLWDYALNFNHGTGHGIGYLLNVHEGPQSIRWKNSDAVFQPGMITSDEPGMYREGRYGIRTETIVECLLDVKNEFGQFLHFEPLTYAPIDLRAIDPSLMDRSDIAKLNDYHKKVWEKVSPYLDGEELSWLKNATREIK